MAVVTSAAAAGGAAMGAQTADYSFKLLLIGDSGVGKSSLLLRFADGGFEELLPTIGVDFKVCNRVIDSRKVKMTVWDTAGQERFRTMTTAYYRGAHGVILVYDVTKRESFENLQVWLRETNQYTTRSQFVRMIVGNKLDQEADRQVSREEGERFARLAASLFCESSAKNSEGVQYAFEELVRKILEVPELLDTVGRPVDNIAVKGESNEESSCAC
ncbi:Ras-related protein RABC2a [Porphyridium purpureum]|uniref:Ras-related protein RABC2a n=1 Tax=Porphyridium purpureum TaxID=35688 RepID=A0A5J4Z2B7_PORPP|nr:Ras-related protein RABC2a [Porphyridium purpureum]|eukprot:POR7308..scf295_1